MIFTIHLHILLCIINKLQISIFNWLYNLKKKNLLRIILFFNLSICIVLLLSVACWKVLLQLILESKYCKFRITTAHTLWFLLFILSQAGEKSWVENKSCTGGEGHSKDFSFLQQILIILSEIGVKSLALLEESTTTNRNRRVSDQFEGSCNFSAIWVGSAKRF